MAKNEYIKYNPANFAPDYLFCPPTMVTHEKLIPPLKEIGEELETGKPGLERNLLIGTELEIMFFDPDTRPSKVKDYHVRNQYIPRDAHLKKIARLGFFSMLNRIKNSKEFMATSKIGQVTFEFRTHPQSISDHLMTLSRLRDCLVRESTKLEILPIVYSQHLHVSLLENGLPQTPSRFDLQDFFSQFSPLVLLPEEWEQSQTTRPAKSRDYGRYKRLRNLEHVEFRKLSSEYAHDPILNLLLSIYAFSSCLGYRHYTPVWYESYAEAAVQLKRSPHLKNVIGQSTLNQLSKIIKQYPKVSTGDISVDQVVR